MPDANLSPRVLGCIGEDGQWAAHCLETDLVGYGPTFEKAMETLHELTEMQLSFAVFKGQPELLNHPAPLWVLETYAQLFHEYLMYPAPRRRSFRKSRVAPT